ncbi:BTAD domain-containing putative transcriptional regulator [Nocardia sp. NPDC020380]|uniref:AfsR/SARP family transcriptional regulator n=1 Tax=Nocardia sp. NPDC020380 TaxID=3364309 RepID=UPI00379B9547
MQVGLLGPTTVAMPGAPSAVLVRGPKVRALFVLLALDAGRAVSTPRLIDRIWDERPPRAADNALHTLVRRLRAIVPGDLVEYTPGGYRLAIDPDAVDLHRFGRLLDDGRRHLGARRARAAAAHADEALRLWRGPALCDVSETAHLRVISDAAADQRLDAIELRAEAYLALGRGAEVVRELTVEAAAHPFREILHAHLVTALTAAGRKPEALQAYRRAEAMLHDELGIAPSPVLRNAIEQLSAPETGSNVVELYNDWRIGRVG